MVDEQPGFADCCSCVELVFLDMHICLLQTSLLLLALCSFLPLFAKLITTPSTNLCALSELFDGQNP